MFPTSSGSSRAGGSTSPQPIARRYPLADAAYAAVDRGEIRGRAIVTMG